jgi:hypothetical protein
VGAPGDDGTTGDTGYTGPAASDANPWSTYSISWTASTSNPGIGNGTLAGRYKQVGKTVFVNIQLVIGSSTTLGTGYWQFSLPVTAQSTNAVILNGIFSQPGTQFLQGSAITSYDNNTGYVVPLLNNGASGSTTITSSSPFSWATSNILTLSGMYEST